MSPRTRIGARYVGARLRRPRASRQFPFAVLTLQSTIQAHDHNATDQQCHNSDPGEDLGQSASGARYLRHRRGGFRDREIIERRGLDMMTFSQQGRDLVGSPRLLRSGSLTCAISMVRKSRLNNRRAGRIDWNQNQVVQTSASGTGSPLLQYSDHLKRGIRDSDGFTKGIYHWGTAPSAGRSRLPLLALTRRFARP